MKTYEIRGPRVGPHQFTEVTPQLAWKPCGTEPTLDLNTELRVSRGPDLAKVNSLSMSSSDGSIKQTYRLKWKPCS